MYKGRPESLEDIGFLKIINGGSGRRDLDSYTNIEDIMDVCPQCHEGTIDVINTRGSRGNRILWTCGHVTME